MCWFQGENDSSVRWIHKQCISRWRSLNPDWDVNVLDNEKIKTIIPEYFDIIGDNEVLLPTRSEVVRILLLRKFGGIWADTNVYPMYPLDYIIPKILNDTGFFTYRFFPRVKRKLKGTRDAVSWFLVADRPGHPLIVKWSDMFLSRFNNWPDDPKYFQFHEDLATLYDSDAQVKNIIDNMVQIDEKIPHSAIHAFSKRTQSYIYKKPKLHL